MTGFNKGTLYCGRAGGCVVSDAPSPDSINGADEVKFYGGHLIGESMTPANAERAALCWNACNELSNEYLAVVAQAGGFEEIQFPRLVAKNQELESRIAALRREIAAMQETLDIPTRNRLLIIGTVR